MKAFLKSILDIVFPAICYICKVPSQESICASCRGNFEHLTPPFCQCCGISVIPSEKLCHMCLRNHPSYDLVRSHYVYRGEMKKAIIAFKFHKKRELAEILSCMMLQLFEQEFFSEKIDMLIPVPLHKIREKTRGFNQAELLANYIGKERKIPVNKWVMERIRQTETMKKLGREKRFENMKGAFSLNNPSSIIGKSILLVDDIITTGATLNECALILKRSGASRVSGITLARTLHSKV